MSCRYASKSPPTFSLNKYTYITNEVKERDQTITKFWESEYIKSLLNTKYVHKSYNRSFCRTFLLMITSALEVFLAPFLIKLVKNWIYSHNSPSKAQLPINQYSLFSFFWVVNFLIARLIFGSTIDCVEHNICEVGLLWNSKCNTHWKSLVKIRNQTLCRSAFVPIQ